MKKHELTEVFNKIWDLKPEKKGKVYIYNKTKDVHEKKKIYRNYTSYLKIPPFDTSLKKSYMFDGVEKMLPEVLKPYLNAAQEVDKRFNSVYVNWYEPDDYIDPHTDCDAYMPKDYLIGIYTLNENSEGFRDLVLTNRKTGAKKKTPLKDGFVFLTPELNKQYRHEVWRGSHRRISITFRMFETEGSGE